MRQLRHLLEVLHDGGDQMSLRIWLPLNGDLRNNGIDDVTITNNGATVDNNGKIGKCYYFNGSSYIDTGCTESIGTGDFTISAWVYITQAGKTYQCIVGNKSTGAASVGFALYWNPNQKKFLWSTADGTGATEIWSMNTFDDIIYNSWHHIVMIRNSNDSKIGYFYLDGIRKEIASTPSIRNITSANTIKIGSVYPTATSYYFTGKINDLRIYDHALSEKEIKKISQGLILHYPLNRNGFGQENLLKNSHTKLDNAGYYVGTYSFADPSELVTGEKYTFSFNGELQDETQTGWHFNIFPSPYTGIAQPVTEPTGRYSCTFTMPENGGNRTSIGCYSTPIGNRKGCAIWDVKLEKGEKATPWCPNSADTIYTTLGLDDNIEYDMSGYERNAIRYNGITFDSDSPKFNSSTVFNSSTYSYIKCDSNDWMVPMTEMTIFCWCYMDDWTQFGQGYGRLWSCTEGGGFNVEWLNSKMEFAVCTSPSGYLPSEAKCGVTLSDLTSGWHLFIYVYTTAGTRLYIDGNLYKSYEITSNYVTYNTNARLFLGCEANTASPYSPYFKGKMSDFRIYATALSQADIAELYSIHRS